MKSILIVYATREGQTSKVANFISRSLRKANLRVYLHNSEKPFNLKLSQFDFVLCGASLHAGTIEKELLIFLKMHKKQLDCMPKAFFLLSLVAATKEEEIRNKSLKEVETKLKFQLPVKFSRIEMIAGALTYSKYSTVVKWTMRAIAKKACGDTDISKDYEYTDWEQVEQFSQSLMSAR